MAIVTVLKPGALPGPPYASFAGKAPAAPPPPAIVPLFRTGERWNEGPVFVSHGNTLEDLLRLAGTSAERVIVNTPTGEADTLLEIRHGLGRVPQGVRIVNVVLASAEEPTWYRLLEDKAWTEREVSIRFRFDDAEVLLEIS